MIPLSTALSETSPESIQDLLSRNPPYLDQDLDRIITLIRENRLRLEKANSEGTKIRQTRVKTPSEPTEPTQTAEDVGL